MSEVRTACITSSASPTIFTAGGRGLKNKKRGSDFIFAEISFFEFFFLSLSSRLVLLQLYRLYPFSRERTPFFVFLFIFDTPHPTPHTGHWHPTRTTDTFKSLFFPENPDTLFCFGNETFGGIQYLGDGWKKPELVLRRVRRPCRILNVGPLDPNFSLFDL